MSECSPFTVKIWLYCGFYLWRCFVEGGVAIAVVAVTVLVLVGGAAVIVLESLVTCESPNPYIPVHHHTSAFHAFSCRSPAVEALIGGGQTWPCVMFRSTAAGNQTNKQRTLAPLFFICICNRVGTMFCENPSLYEDSDDEEGTDDMIVRQAEGARVGGRMLCALDR